MSVARVRDVDVAALTDEDAVREAEQAVATGPELAHERAVVAEPGDEAEVRDTDQDESGAVDRDVGRVGQSAVHAVLAVAQRDRRLVVDVRRDPGSPSNWRLDDTTQVRLPATQKPKGMWISSVIDVISAPLFGSKTATRLLPTSATSRRPLPSTVHRAGAARRRPDRFPRGAGRDRRRR